MEILCPKCRKKYVVSDSLTGKQARCKTSSCGQVFTIAAQAAVAPKPAAAPAKPIPMIGDNPAMASLLDELPPLPSDNFSDAEFPAVVGPSYSPLRSKSSHKKKWPSSFVLKLGGGVAVALVVVFLLVLLVMNLSFGGSDWPPYYFIPENTQFVAYVNLDDLRNSDVYPEIRKQLEKQSPQFEGNVGPDDVSEIFIADSSAGRKDNSVAVIRLKRDRPLSDLLPKALRDQRQQQQTKTYRNVEYAVLNRPFGTPPMVFAKTGERTFCVVPGEEMLKAALDRRERKERAKLDANLQAAISSLSGSSLYVAGVNLANPNVPFTVKWFSGRVSVGSSFRLALTAGFDNPNEAADCKKAIDGFISMMTSMTPPEKKKEIEPILSPIKISQNGNELRCEATWRNSDVLNMLKKAQNSRGAFSRPPTPF